MRILKTLIKKDCKNCISNKNILFILATPILFCVLYNYVLGDEMQTQYVLQLCSIFTISMIPTSVLPMMIAEEKEKYTLRSLMLANVNGLEFLGSKLVVCTLLTLLDSILVYVIAEGEPEKFPVYLLALLISSSGLLFLGAVAGLLSKDQTSAGTIGSPLMMLVMIPPLFSSMNKTIEKMAVILPTTSFQTILVSSMDGKNLMTRDNLVAVLVCMVWIIAGYVIFHIFYQRRGMDY